MAQARRRAWLDEGWCVMTNELEHLAAIHRHSRGVGQTHAVIAGAVEWARTAPGIAVVIVGTHRMMEHAQAILAKLAPPQDMGRVWVQTVDWLTECALGWSGPVLLDGTAVVELARRAEAARSAVAEDHQREVARLRAEIADLERRATAAPQGGA